MIVIGGGISGVACARRLHDAGLPVRLLERGHRLGGRMASRTEQVNGRAHPVDIGAPYFTVREPRFADVVTALESAGLARRWTDTFTLAGPTGRTGETAGPQRWSSTRGLRALVEALAADVPARNGSAHQGSALDGAAHQGSALDGAAHQGSALDVRLETEVARVEYDSATGVPMVDGEPAAAVVLAMPDPQAARLLPTDLADRLGVSGREFAPVLAVWAAWPDRWWPAFDGIFVADSEVLAWVADSGRSRGDGAAVLVTHTTPGFASAYTRELADPVSAIQPVFAELRRVIGVPVPPPEWERVHRWSLASARQTHPEQFLLVDGPTRSGSADESSPAGGLIGICGDAWGPRSRVEQAWLSGDGLAEVLLRRLTVSS